MLLVHQIRSLSSRLFGGSTPVIVRSARGLRNPSTSNEQEVKISSTEQTSDKSDVELPETNDGGPAKTFINRNPRNLEMMGIAWKRKGWNFQYPSREYYHRLIFERTNRHTSAYVEHCSGLRVIMASTAELAIARHLHSTNDVAAASNVGRVLAQRCREAGITSMIFQTLDNNEASTKLEAFRAAMLEGCIDLTEREEQVPDYQPGIDYDDQEAMDDLSRRQWLVYHLGEESTTIKDLKDNRRLKTRRRRWRRPTELEMPSYTFVS